MPTDLENFFTGKAQELSIVSNDIGYGLRPQADEEVEQHLSVTVDGCVSFSAYIYGNGDKYTKSRSKNFKIDPRKAADILDMVGDCFSDEYAASFVTDVGIWEMTLTDEKSAAYYFQGSLCPGCSKKLDHISDVFRLALAMPELLVFNGCSDSDGMERALAGRRHRTKVQQGALPEGANGKCAPGDDGEHFAGDQKTEPSEHTYVFVHGLGQDASAWDKTLSLLKDAAPAACPDLFALPEGRALTYENLYAAFAAYCDGLPGQLHLCGLSLGAVLALQYAAARPEKAASLVLIGAQYKMPKMLLRLQNAVFRFMPARAFGAMGLPKRDLLELTKSMLGLDLSGALPAVRCKTLVLCGEKDKANRKAALELAQHLPRARFCPVAGAGHEANADAPGQLASLLQDFYAQITEA